MKREIKFKAWDSYNKRFLTNLLYRIDGVVPIPSSHILLQYTGLKDKKGIEIYEGDIVAYNGEMEVVEYGTINEEAYGYYFLYELMDKFQIHLKYSDIEVIGNIYEDKHLIK